ncbi:hypothetical protein [Roseateles noduli]|uniref:hypothetical protein n=1 Tax=Roseateles noduli TaxID=2052484 RepID=UPI003D655FB1
MTEQPNLSHRAFRAQLLSSGDQNSSFPTEDFFGSFPRLTGPRSRTFSEARDAISAFRNSAAEYLADAGVAKSPVLLELARRALGLPAELSRPPGTLKGALLNLWWLAPEAARLKRAKALLSDVKTLEGRRYVFEHFLQATLFGQGYYCEASDLALRRFAPETAQDLKFLTSLGAPSLRAAYAVGIRTAQEASEYLPRHPSPRQGVLLLLLAQEQVIRGPNELAWLSQAAAPAYHDFGVYPEELAEARRMVRTLMQLGLDREAVATVLGFPLGHFSHEQLAENTALLVEELGLDINQLFQECSDLIWRARPAAWRFLSEVLQLATPADFGRFRELLQAYDLPSEALVTRLRSLGATTLDLAKSEPLLVATARCKVSETYMGRALTLLSSAPFSLAPEQLARCNVYLCHEGDIETFLGTLQLHNLTSAEAVLAFQDCYKGSTGRSLGLWLPFTKNRSRGASLAEIASWVQDAACGGYHADLTYLCEAVDLPDMSALRQALKLVPLGAGMLRYIVEEQGLPSLKAIRHWYYKEAAGIVGFRSWGPVDAIGRVLLDDAWRRNNFALVDSNRQSARDVIDLAVNPQMGRFPFGEPEAVRDEHHRQRDRLEKEELAKLLPLIPRILAKTKGVLLPSLLDAARQNPDSLQDQLDVLTPLLQDLLEGRGPIGNSLKPLEAEAIALVYRTGLQDVHRLWRDVAGRHERLPIHQLGPYPVQWSFSRLRARAPLDREGIRVLAEAARFARNFEANRSKEMFLACRHLSPKQLLNPAAERSALAHHLGSLLVLARRDSVVSEWVSNGLEALEAMEEESRDAYQRVSTLLSLFSVVLHDALEAHARTYVQSLLAEDAELWALRLGPAALAPTLRGHALLNTMIAAVRKKVIPAFQRWAQHEIAKFEEDRSERPPHVLKAIASKHPAAYFAKTAVHLCTENNVRMWQEDRHLHLVVFDPVDQRMAAMALLYVEPLSAIAGHRPGLVIRALNPTDEMLAEHTVESIVSSFMETAIQLAHDNQLAFVAFPSPCGSHLMSNREPVEAYVRSRYIKRSTRTHSYRNSEPPRSNLLNAPTEVDADFYAYEHGEERVQSMYVIWRSNA